MLVSIRTTNIDVYNVPVLTIQEKSYTCIIKKQGINHYN